ncbi:MAG: hypothetical protein ACI9FB_001022 [Candidatus Azotimanducaceae bacterium]|jgi:hypothetical protein
MSELTYFSYENAPLEIRDDIKQAHRKFWETLSRAGNWWSGSDRIAIAQEVRNASTCEYCQKRKIALSPYTFKGEHKHSTHLPLSAVDAIHRIITDQHRITQQYIDDNVDGGLPHTHYVELAGVAVAVFSIDEFNRGLGIALEPLPKPCAGKPDNYQPAKTVKDIAFVPMLPANGATGAESDLWHKDQTANVLRALTLVPNALRDWQSLSSAQYLSIEGMGNFVQQKGRAINRMQMELIAGRVSSYNECFY